MGRGLADRRTAQPGRDRQGAGGARPGAPSLRRPWRRPPLAGAAGAGLADPLAALVQIGALLGPEAPSCSRPGGPRRPRIPRCRRAGPWRRRREPARAAGARNGSPRSLTRRRYTSPPNLVGVAQLVELLVVVQAVGGSSPSLPLCCVSRHRRQMSRDIVDMVVSRVAGTCGWGRVSAGAGSRPRC